MKNTKTRTFAEEIVFQLDEMGKSQITISRNLDGLKTAIIYKKEFNEISVIQERDLGDALVVFFDENEVSSLIEIIK